MTQHQTLFLIQNYPRSLVISHRVPAVNSKRLSFSMMTLGKRTKIFSTPNYKSKDLKNPQTWISTKSSRRGRLVHLARTNHLNLRWCKKLKLIKYKTCQRKYNNSWWPWSLKSTRYNNSQQVSRRKYRRSRKIKRFLRSRLVVIRKKLQCQKCHLPLTLSWRMVAR